VIKTNKGVVMKRLIFITSFLIAFASLNAKPIKAHVGVNFDYFYTSLSPYGEWIEIDYDVIVWRPSYVRRHWSPYSEGRWTYTNYGWYWDSYEPFGWATYHYGRWYNDDYYGWVWFPDYEWGPSWVEWRYNDNYVGWAPLPPYASFHVDFGIRFSIGWHSRHSYWNFVSYPRFCHRDVNYYIIDRSTNINIYNTTKYRTNYNYRDGRIYNGGIERNVVERRSGYRVAERSVRTTNDFSSYKRRGNNDNDVITYRPSEREVQKSRGVDKNAIVKGSSRSSVDVSKITTRSSKTQVTRNDVTKSRNAEVRKSEVNNNRKSISKSDKNKSRTKTEVNRNFSKKSESNSEVNLNKRTASSKNKVLEKGSSKYSKNKSNKSAVNKNSRESNSVYKKNKSSYSKKKTDSKSNYSKKSYSKPKSESRKKSVKSKSYNSNKSKSKSYKSNVSKKSNSKSYSGSKKAVSKDKSRSKKNSRR
jgi:hypothetical protein